LLQVASEELLKSMILLKETNDSQFVMNRMLLIIDSLNEYRSDGYNNIGENSQCLVYDEKLKYLEILHNEFIPN